MRCWVQRKYPSGWATIQTWPARVATFAANGERHSLTLSRTHTIPDNAFYFHRVKFRLRAWHGTELLASSKFIGHKCPVFEGPE